MERFEKIDMIRNRKHIKRLKETNFSSVLCLVSLRDTIFSKTLKAIKVFNGKVLFMSAIMMSHNPFVVSRGIDGMPTLAELTSVRTN